MTKPPPTHLLAGEIGKPHGISGEVYVVPISDDPRRFQPGSSLLWETKTLVVASSRRHGNRLLVKFEGVDTRDQAETLKGPLFVAVSETRALENGEFWPHELIGCEVRSADGVGRGTVKEVMPGAAHDLLVLNTELGDRMVPLVRDIVRDVDTKTGIIVIDPPEGLLD